MIKSGVDSLDISSPVELTVKDRTGKNNIYTLNVSSFTGLPMVFIYTNNNEPITSKDNYVNGIIQIYENMRITTSSEIGIRGRGNSTWGLPKNHMK